MALVENDIVKMEWEKKEWLQTSGKGAKKPVFILAAKTYDTDKYGEISVIFTTTTAFLFVDGGLSSEDVDDVWGAREVIDTVKDEMRNGSLSGTFPYGYTNYVAVIDSGEEFCNDDILEKYDLVQFKTDIEARLRDVAPYGAEEIVSLNALG